MYNPNIKKIKTYKPGKPIEELRRELGLRQVHKLASNEIPFAPTYLKDSLAKELKFANRYPEGSCYYLRDKLYKKLKVKKEQLIFGNGSDEIIVMALRSLMKSDEHIIIGSPTFLVYEIQAAAQGLKIKKVPMLDYRYDLDTIAKKINSKTKIVFIANPDNPHGTYLNNSEISNFLKKIPQRVIVFLDEAYFEFVSAKKASNSIKFLKQRGNIIITRTFSKAYGLAGLRIGYGVSTASIVQALNKVREPFNVNRFAQVAAAKALDNKEFLKNVIRYIDKEKKFLYQCFDSLGITYIKSATNFILVKFGSQTKDLFNYMLNRGIILREMSGWGLDNFFRITVGLHSENRLFVKYLKQYLN